LNRGLPDARLPRAAELAEHGTLDSQIEIRVVKDDKRRISTQLEADFLQRTRRQLGQHLSYAGRAGETKLLDQRVRSQLGGGLAVLGGADLDGGGRQTSPNRQPGEGDAGEGRLAGRLDDDGAAGGEGRADFPGDHGRREVPWRDDGAHPDGLAEGHESCMGGGRRDCDTVRTSRFFGEPRYEARGVDNFSFGLALGLAIFQGEDRGNYSWSCEDMYEVKDYGSDLRSSWFSTIRSYHFLSNAPLAVSVVLS
jgi:hypothetical protein